MIYSVILRLLHVGSSNATKTTLHRALANDGYSRSKHAFLFLKVAHHLALLINYLISIQYLK